MLGPLLFLLYIDDIHSSVLMFADDIALRITSLSDQDLLQADLSQVI